MSPLRTTRLWRLSALALLGALACGGEPEPTPASPLDAPRAEARSEPAPTPGNARPRIEEIAFEPANPASGETVQVVTRAVDDDGDPLWFRYEWTIQGEPMEGGSKLLLRGLSKGDSIEVRVTANDGKVESESRSTRTEVRNEGPRLHRVELEPSSGLTVGKRITARPRATDMDADSMSFHYAWFVNGKSVPGKGAIFDTKGLQRGDTVKVEVVASDGVNESAAVTGEVSIANAAPVILSQPGEMPLDGVFLYRVAAEDPDGDRDLHFALEEAPIGMGIDPASGEIVWTPEPGQAGLHNVAVVVEDAQGAPGRQVFELDVAEPAEPAAMPAAGATYPNLYP